MSHPLPPKKEVALALLERSSVHVHLDPRAAGVVVPLFLKSQPQLVLQIGLNMPVPIPDLRLDDAGMTCTLSFNRSPFYCVIPWGSIFAMIGDDGRGMIWKDDVPPEVAKPSQARPDRPATAPAEITGRPLRAAPNPPESTKEVEGAARKGKGAASASSAATPKKGRKRVERTVDRAKEPLLTGRGSSSSASARDGRDAKDAPARESRGGLSAVPSPAPSSPAEAQAERTARRSPRESREPNGASAGSTGSTANERRPAARPAPAAAPAPAPGASAGRDEMPPPGDQRGQRGPGAPSGAGQGRPAPRRPGGPPRPKRELPPYLRVVK
jgi:hypothetical protein